MTDGFSAETGNILYRSTIFGNPPINNGSPK